MSPLMKRGLSARAVSRGRPVPPPGKSTVTHWATSLGAAHHPRRRDALRSGGGAEAGPGPNESGPGSTAPRDPSVIRPFGAQLRRPPSPTALGSAGMRHHAGAAPSADRPPDRVAPHSGRRGGHVHASCMMHGGVVVRPRPPRTVAGRGGLGRRGWGRLTRLKARSRAALVVLLAVVRRVVSSTGGTSQPKGSSRRTRGAAAMTLGGHPSFVRCAGRRAAVAAGPQLMGSLHRTCECSLTLGRCVGAGRQTCPGYPGRARSLAAPVGRPARSRWASADRATRVSTQLKEHAGSAASSVYMGSCCPACPQCEQAKLYKGERYLTAGTVASRPPSDC
eukprot:scaffold518_cov388-Prasinococcus_capsulatus_cf.AAC.46